MLNVNDIKFRASGVGQIMTNPRDKSELLSDTCKKFLTELFIQHRYGRFNDIKSKYLDKGHEVEEDSITTVALLYNKWVEKNEKSFEDDWNKGTPDLCIGDVKDVIEQVDDTKSSWDLFTFYKSKTSKLDPIYYWQLQTYFGLTGAKRGKIHFCLNNTPYHLVEKELRSLSYQYPEGNTPAWVELQTIANHVYDRKTLEEYMNIRGVLPDDNYAAAIVKGFEEIPLKERHHAFQVERNQSDILLMRSRVEVCREHMKRTFQL